MSNDCAPAPSSEATSWKCVTCHRLHYRTYPAYVSMLARALDIYLESGWPAPWWARYFGGLSC